MRMGDLLNEFVEASRKPRHKDAVERLREAADKQTLADFEAAIRDTSIGINTIDKVLKRRGLPSSYEALASYRRKVLTK
jgi:hypothetical protein